MDDDLTNQEILDKLRDILGGEMYVLAAEEFEGVSFYIPKREPLGIKQEQIIKLFEEKKKRRDIAKIIGVNYRYVNRVLNKYIEEKDIIALYKQGKNHLEIAKATSKKHLQVHFAIEDWKRNNRSNKKHLATLCDFVGSGFYNRILAELSGTHFYFRKKRLRVTDLIKTYIDDNLDFETIFIRVCEQFHHRKKRKDYTDKDYHSYSKAYIYHLIGKYKRAKEIAYGLRDGTLL